MSGISWQSHGSGPPLLMVNGYAATGVDWDPILLGKLARRFTVVCPDNRGTGSSPPAEGELGIASMAADLLGVFDELGAERAPVVGWSMGGFVAQELAARHPERVSVLILMATDPGGPAAVMAEAEATARLFDHSGTPREQATRLLGLLFAERVAQEVDAQVGDVVAAARAKLSPEALGAQERAMAAWYEEPSDRRSAAIAAPTLVMAGEDDIVIPAANAPLLAEAIEGAQLRTFPGAGHGFIAQEAPSVAGAIADFVNEHEHGGGDDEKIGRTS
jgi:pimeloyl-ACP methyl ester carboxylesterase